MIKPLKSYMTTALPGPLLLTGLLALGLGVLAGCDSTADDPQMSRVRVLLTDAPAEDFAEANVTIERVEFLNEEDAVVLLTDDPEPFDLLTLQDGTTALLADLEIPNDTYHGIRIIVNEEAHVVYVDGTTEDLKVPSGSQTGIKVNLPPIEVDDDLVEVTIDFDLEGSFVKRGNSGKGYIFKPVLKPLALSINEEDVDLDGFNEALDDDEG